MSYVLEGLQENCLHLVPEEYFIAETKGKKGLSCSELPLLPRGGRFYA